MRLMHSLLLVDKAEDAARYSSEALGDGRDAYARGTVCQSVFAVVNVCEEEGDTQSERRSNGVSVQAICPRFTAFIG